MGGLMNILAVIGLVSIVVVMAAMRMAGICAREEERAEDGKVY